MEQTAPKTRAVLCNGFLSGILRDHLGDSSISDESIRRLEQRISELLRLERAVYQSENALKRLTDEAEQLQSREAELSKEIETGQRLQWELEQKLERLSTCRSEAEGLKHALTEMRGFRRSWMPWIWPRIL